MKSVFSRRKRVFKNYPQQDTSVAKKSDITPSTFLKNEIILKLFRNIDKILENYESYLYTEN